jgi:hypothetical protein
VPPARRCRDRSASGTATGLIRFHAAERAAMLAHDYRRSTDRRRFPHPGMPEDPVDEVLAKAWVVQPALFLASEGIISTSA